MKKRGWEDDFTLAAGGLGGQILGYSKRFGDKTYSIEVTTRTKAQIVSKQNEPVQSQKCPCPYEIIVSVREKTDYGATVLYPYEVGSGIEPPDDWFKLQIGCAPKSPNSTPRSIVDSLNQRDTGYGVPRVEGIEELTLNSSFAFRQTVIPSVGPSVLEYYIFPDGDTYYTLGFTPANTNATDIINQILSTFKFTN